MRFEIRPNESSDEPVEARSFTSRCGITVRRPARCSQDRSRRDSRGAFHCHWPRWRRRTTPCGLHGSRRQHSPDLCEQAVEKRCEQGQVGAEERTCTSGTESTAGAKLARAVVFQQPARRATRNEAKAMRAEYDFTRGERKAILSSKGKTRISIFIDNAVLDGFRARGEAAGIGYQTMINEALKQYLAESQRPVTEARLRAILTEVLPSSREGLSRRSTRTRAKSARAG